MGKDFKKGGGVFVSFKKHFCEIIWNQAIVLETGMFYFSFIFLFSFFFDF